MSQSVPFEPQTNTIRVNHCPCSCVCSSYPSCPIYPPVCPPVMPQPTCTNPALYNQSTESLTVNEGAAVPLPNVVKIGTGLSYDPTTGLITVTAPGEYLFQWNVLGTGRQRDPGYAGRLCAPKYRRYGLCYFRQREYRYGSRAGARFGQHSLVPDSRYHAWFV